MAKSRMRQYGLPGFELGDLIREAMDFLRRHEPPEGYYVGFSGGKDSIVTLELCRMAGVKHSPHYCCTRIDPPELMRFIKTNYPEIPWLYSKKTFWQMIVEKQPPMHTVRWCCTELKKKPADALPFHRRVIGIRAEESFSRAKYPRVDIYRRRKNITLYKPIFHWQEWAIWEFIEAYKLPYPILYDWGWSRIGCIVCPFILGDSPGQIANRERSMAHWPGMWKAYEHAVKRWFNLKGCRNGLRYNQKFTNAEDFWRAYLRRGNTDTKEVL